MKKIVIAILIIIILIIIGVSIYFLKNKEEEISSIQDISTNILIDNKKLDIKYIGGNMIDEEIAYGNKFDKLIELNNTNKIDLSYSLSIKEIVLSHDLVYDVSYSLGNTDSNFISISSDNVLSNETSLAYNLVVPKKSKVYLKVSFKGKNESENTILKGVLNITSNISEKDVFKQKLDLIQKELNEKIESINGINIKGFYIIDVSNFSLDIRNEFKGYILIDATDISNLIYYYSIYNSKFMLNNVQYSNDNFDKRNILDFDNNIINTLTYDSICSLHTKKGCLNFNSLTYNEIGGRKNFYNNSIKIINLVKDNFKFNESKVYIYDVVNDIKNDTNIRGYILVNNTKVNNPEYYIYLANEYFMISGYNLTKLGEYKSDSSTIRAYNETAFNLSSENISKVCSFSGFDECYNIQGEKVF